MLYVDLDQIKEPSDDEDMSDCLSWEDMGFTIVDSDQVGLYLITDTVYC